MQFGIIVWFHAATITFLLSYDFYYMSFMFVNLLDEYFVCLRVSTGTIFYLSLFSNVLLFYAE